MRYCENRRTKNKFGIVLTARWWNLYSLFFFGVFYATIGLISTLTIKKLCIRRMLGGAVSAPRQNQKIRTRTPFAKVSLTLITFDTGLEHPLIPPNLTQQEISSPPLLCPQPATRVVKTPAHSLAFEPNENTIQAMREE